MKKLYSLLFVLHFSLFTLYGQTWQWVKTGVNDYINSSWGDPWAVASDNSGNAFETGAFAGQIFFGGYTTITTPAGIDAYTVKYSPSGNVLWAAYPIVSSSSQSFAWGVATDGSGNSFITGYYTDTARFGTFNLIENNPNMGGLAGNTFTVKYDAIGNTIWAESSMQPSSSSYSVGETVTTDLAGNIYIAGFFMNTITFGSYTLSTYKISNTGIFVVKYSPSGTVVWAEKGDMAQNYYQLYNIPQLTICCNGSDIYLAGYFLDTLTFGPNTFNNGGYGNFFLIKFNSSGIIQWSNTGTLTGSGYVTEYARKIPCTVDISGNIYVGGVFYESLQIGTQLLSVPASYSGIFLAKYNASGSLLWAENSSGGSYNTYCLSGDNCGNIYYSGDFVDSISIAGEKLTDFNAYPSQPSFLIKLDSSGHGLCGSALNNGNDDNNAVVANPLGDGAYFTGDVDIDTCIFGKDTLTGTNEWAFMAKYSCGDTSCVPCIIHPSISGNANICLGSDDIISVTGGTSYLWNNGATTQTINVSTVSDTVYVVTISNGECSAKDSIRVRVNPGPVTTVCCDSSIIPGQSVQLDATGGVSYNWTPDIDLNCDTCSSTSASPVQTTTYYVTITTDSGCTVTDKVTIDVTCGQVFIPSAFSPNQDGQNDIFYVRGVCIKTMNFLIYDRWGNKVFESHNPSYGWDGNYKGQPMNTGTYAYYFSALMQDGTVMEKHGSITLVR